MKALLFKGHLLLGLHMCGHGGSYHVGLYTAPDLTISLFLFTYYTNASVGGKQLIFYNIT